MKKVLLSLCCLLSASSFANTIWDSPEFKMHHDKIFKYEIGDKVKDYDKEINYLGENWFLLPSENGSYYYALTNPKNNEISQIRIVTPFDDVTTGRELRYFEELLGKSIDTSNFVTYQKGDLKVDVSTDFDLLGKYYDKTYTIIDLIDSKQSLKRSKEYDNIYRNSRMIRHKN